jgi:hypothetical protein
MHRDARDLETATDDYLLGAIGGQADGHGLSLQRVEIQPVAKSLLADGTRQVVISCS